MIVVDTNILVYRSLSGARSEAMERLFRFDPIWTAPPLWRSEYRNVLAHGIRKTGLAVREAERSINRAAQHLLGGERSVPDELVLSLVANSPCTAYDCEFAGLALLLKTVLITADAALLRAFPELCRSLDDIVRR